MALELATYKKDKKAERERKWKMEGGVVDDEKHCTHLAVIGENEQRISRLTAKIETRKV